MFALPDFFDVLFEVRAVEEIRVASIDDLEQQVRLFDDAPKLSPDLDVFLKGRDGELDIIFLHAGNIAAPFQESLVLLCFDLKCRHLARPGRAARDFEGRVLRIGLLRRKLVQQVGLIFNRVDRLRNQLRRGHHGGITLRFKSLLGQLCQLDKLIEGVLLQDGHKSGL